MTRRRWEPFRCMYCGQGEPAALPSEAHIFPIALGGVAAPDDTVCGGCNSTTNREFEQSAVRRLDYYRSVWGIGDRRGRVPRVRATATIDGRAGITSLDESGSVASAIVDKEIRPDGGRRYGVFGPDELVETKRREIDARIPGLTWTETDRKMVKIGVRVENDPGALDLRRLAAKIAIERLADLRGPDYVLGREFDDVRRFVLAGEETRSIAGPVYDPLWMDDRAALGFPLPSHAVAIFGPERRGQLAGFVAVFGLYQYWVVLAAPFDGIAPWDDLLQEHPQAGIVWNPQLRGGLGSLQLPWSRWSKEWTSGPDEVCRAVMDNVQRKHDAAAEAFYGPDDSSEPELIS